MKKVLLLLLSTNCLFAQMPDFISVEGGSFKMGTYTGRKDEAPEHEVTLKSFKVSKTPITVSQYRKYCKERERNMPEAPSWGWKDDHPIVNVSWINAVNYCNWLSASTKKKIKLPTEAQWEYVARGGKNGENHIHSGGRKMNSLGWSRANKAKSTKPVKTKKPNELGVYDMNGNVWEWCLDWYDAKYYAESPKENPENKTFGDQKDRVCRGGGWDSDASTCTVTHRKQYIPKSKYDDRGFRVVELE